MSTVIRDALESVILAGVKAWGLEIPADAVRDGVRCIEDDRELLTAAECLNVPGNVFTDLPVLLQRHPGILGGKELDRAFQDASRGRVETMVKEVSEALVILEPLLRREVDPARLGRILGTLIYLSLEEFRPGAREASHSPGLPDETAGYTVGQYARAAGSPEAEKAHARIMQTEPGRLIDHLVRRRARRIFTLLAFGDRQALAMVLAQIMEEVKHADHRTDPGGDEVHEEEAR